MEKRRLRVFFPLGMRQNSGMNPAALDLSAKRREKIMLLERMMLPLSMDERWLLGIIAERCRRMRIFSGPLSLPLSEIGLFLDADLAQGDMEFWLEDTLGPLEGFWLKAWLVDVPGDALLFRAGRGLACPGLAWRVARENFDLFRG